MCTPLWDEEYKSCFSVFLTINKCINGWRLSWIFNSLTLLKTFKTHYFYKERLAWKPAKERWRNFFSFSFQNSNPQLTGSKPSTWVEITVVCMDRKCFKSFFWQLFLIKGVFFLLCSNTEQEEWHFLKVRKGKCRSDPLAFKCIHAGSNKMNTRGRTLLYTYSSQ